MNEKTIRRSLKTIGTLYGLYGAVALMTLAGSIWTGMKLGREGISQFIDIANIPWTLVLLGHLLLPFMAFVCFGIAYAFLNLKNWGHQLAIALNFVMCVLLMCRVFWPIDLSPTQIERLTELFSERLGKSPDSVTISDVVASFNDGITATEFILKIILLAGISIFCMHTRVRKVMNG